MPDSTTQSIPIARITPDSIVIYYLNPDNINRSKKQVQNEANLTRGEYNGFMSPKTKSKVKRYIDTWLQAVETIKRRKIKNSLDKNPYIAFVTLTLQSKQIHTDNEIKAKCLTPYIETLKRKYNVRNYFWRAEAQANGNIHFHLLIDSFIKWESVREEWNKCTEKLNYITEFEKKHGHRDPNSTDIHSLDEIRSVTHYVIKYCCKSDGYRPIKGRIHGCSDTIRDLKPYEFVIELEDHELIEKATEYKNAYVLNDVCFTYIGLPVYKFLKSVKSNKLKELNNFYEDIGRQLYERNEETEQKRKKIENETLVKQQEKKEMDLMISEAFLQLKLDYKYSQFVN